MLLTLKLRQGRNLAARLATSRRRVLSNRAAEPYVLVVTADPPAGRVVPPGETAGWSRQQADWLYLQLPMCGGNPPGVECVVLASQSSARLPPGLVRFTSLSSIHLVLSLRPPRWAREAASETGGWSPRASWCTLPALEI